MDTLMMVDRGQTREAIQEAAGRVADLVRPLADTGVLLLADRWTVGEAAAHLASVGPLFCEWAAGEYRLYGDGTPDGLAHANAGKLSEFSERSGPRLAELIVDSTRAFLAATEGRPGSARVRTPLVEMDVDTLQSYMLTHLLGHGWSIARALRKPLPLRRDLVLLCLPFFATVMPAVLESEKTRELSASFMVHFRGGPKVAVVFEKGNLSVGTTAPGRVDCHIHADPAAFFLVAMGLRTQWGPIVTGKLMTWGTKPWLALQFTGLFRAP
jgi:hypothetical protein